MSSSLAPYPTPEARDRELVDVAAKVGAEVVRYGESVEGRPLQALRIPSSKKGAARVLVCANTHGPEFIGNRTCIGLATSAQLERVRQVAELWLAPCLNPDGYARTWEREGVGPLAKLRHNARGVDLNRNWPLPAGERRRALPGAGSARPGDPTYFGESALSEPETASLDRLLIEQDFHASANLHSFLGVLFPPRVRDRPSHSTYRGLCSAFSSAQRTPYRRVASRVFDVFTGEQEDHQHHTRRTWSICIECFPLAASFRQHARAPSLFWRFNPHEPERWIENDVPGIAAFLLAACAIDRPSA